jgi:hypothetical protein
MTDPGRTMGPRHAIGIWPWKMAGGWALAVTVGWLALSFSSGEAEGILVASPLCIGVMVFFLLGGMAVLVAEESDPERAAAQRWAREHPWSFAAGPTLGVTVAVIAARRAVALWELDESLAGSALDGLARGTISLVILVVTAHVMRRRAPGG